MMRVDRKDNYISVCRKNLLQLLNRPQGGRTTVRFIDIDLALDILEKFEESNWSLTPMDPVSSGASKEWIAAYEINQAFTTNFNEILQEERILIDEQLYTLREIVGDSDPKEIFTQISNWVETMKQLQKPYQLEPKPSATATKLTRVINSLEQVVKEQRPKTLALRLSGILPTMKEADEYQQFLQSFKNEVNKQLAQLQQRFAQLQDETARSTPPALVERTYQEIETILTSTIHEGKEILS
jgi:exonuclease VII large subunit